jgi:hypothetical protein
MKERNWDFYMPATEHERHDSVRGGPVLSKASSRFFFNEPISFSFSFFMNKNPQNYN